MVKRSTLRLSLNHLVKKSISFFGKESTGIDKKILASHLDQTFRIPTTDKVRSINLSNAVAIVAYEALRQLDFPRLTGL